MAASSDNPTGLDNLTGLGGVHDTEQQEGHARVWLDRPFDVHTIIEEVAKIAEHKLLPRPFFHLLPRRIKMILFFFWHSSQTPDLGYCLPGYIACFSLAGIDGHAAVLTK